MSIGFSDPTRPPGSLKRVLPPDFITQQEEARLLAHDLRSPLTVLRLGIEVFDHIPDKLPASERKGFTELLCSGSMRRFRHEIDLLSHGIDQLKVLNPGSIQTLHDFFAGTRIKNATVFANDARNEMLKFLEKSKAHEDEINVFQEYLVDYLPGDFLQSVKERILRVTPVRNHAVVNLTDLIRKNFRKYGPGLPKEGLHVFGDSLAIVDAVLNVLTNSSDHKRVGVDFKQTLKLRADGNAAVLEVFDNGKGIPPFKVAQLNQGYHVESSKTDGSGTGTIIARKMAQSHGGSLVYDSHYNPDSREPHGAWTTATFRIPLHRV